RSPLFPYPTLFRSVAGCAGRECARGAGGSDGDGSRNRRHGARPESPWAEAAASREDPGRAQPLMRSEPELALEPLGGGLVVGPDAQHELGLVLEAGHRNLGALVSGRLTQKPAYCFEIPI